MRKKLIAVLCAIVMTMCIAGCSGGGSMGESQTAQTVQGDTKTDAPIVTQPKNNLSAEEFETAVTKDVESAIASLAAEYETLAADINSYDKYVNNIEAVETFYVKALEDTDNLGVKLRQYCIDYAENVFASDRTNGQKYDDFEVMYDVVYEDARDDMYDEIYDGILKDAYDLFYDGILKDAYDSVGYGELSEVRTREYNSLSDVRSDVYEVCSDLGSDVYDFYSDVRGELYDGDLEKAQEKTADFQEDINKLRG